MTTHALSRIVLHNSAHLLSVKDNKLQGWNVEKVGSALSAIENQLPAVVTVGIKIESPGTYMVGYALTVNADTHGWVSVDGTTASTVQAARLISFGGESLQPQALSGTGLLVVAAQQQAVLTLHIHCGSVHGGCNPVNFWVVQLPS